MTTPPEQVLGECVRVLQCFDCKSMEELPDWQGHPDDDVTLHYMDEKHGGATQQPHTRTLHRVEVRIWEDRTARKQIVDGMWETTTGFRPAYYDVKQTLMDDAMKCHIAHRRQVPCIDWKDSSKIIKPPTTGLRQKLAKELPRGLHHIDRDRLAKGAPIQHLCDYCPVKSAVEYAKRQARGEA